MDDLEAAPCLGAQATAKVAKTAKTSPRDFLVQSRFCSGKRRYRASRLHGALQEADATTQNKICWRGLGGLGGLGGLPEIISRRLQARCRTFANVRGERESYSGGQS